jgi:hypothetical protein
MLRSVFLKLGGAWLGSQYRAAYEGKYGETVKAIAWWLAGKKRAIGYVLAAAAIVVVAVHADPAVAAALATLSGLAVAGGFVDKSFRDDRPWESLPAWTLIRDRGADALAILGGLAAMFTTCTPTTAALLAHVHLGCKAAVVVVTAVTAVFTWMLGEAKTAIPPKA